MRGVSENIIEAGLTFSAASTSFTACLWLLRKLLRFPPDVRRRLFPQQLIVLATGDCVLHLSTVLRELAYCFLPVGRAQLFCDHLHVMRACGVYTSVLVETHIAVTFALQAYRRFTYVDRMSGMLWILWLLSVGLVWVQFLVDPAGLGSDDDNLAMGFFPAIVCLTCFAICVVAYAAMVARMATSQMPETVARRNFLRAAVYPANYFLTYGLAIVLLGIIDAETHPQTRVVGDCLLNLNGLVNVMTYYMQSRYVNTAAAITHKDSTGRRSVLTTRTGGRTMREVSGRVEFGGVDIVDVAPMQRDADCTAESEMQAMDSERLARITKYAVTLMKENKGDKAGIMWNAGTRTSLLPDLSGYRIAGVVRGSLAQSWNEEHPDAAIEADDVLISLNGKTVQDEVANEFQKSLELNFEMAKL